jgi:hypothetical protein
MKASLSQLKIAVLMLDGIVCGEHTIIVALGIDEQGAKHVLGNAEGAAENSSSCAALLANLIDRGLPSCAKTLLLSGFRILAPSS